MACDRHAAHTPGCLNCLARGPLACPEHRAYAPGCPTCKGAARLAATTEAGRLAATRDAEDRTGGRP